MFCGKLSCWSKMGNTTAKRTLPFYPLEIEWDLSLTIGECYLAARLGMATVSTIAATLLPISLVLRLLWPGFARSRVRSPAFNTAATAASMPAASRSSLKE